MRNTKWLETNLPVMPGREFQLNFNDVGGGTTIGKAIFGILPNKLFPL